MEYLLGSEVQCRKMQDFHTGRNNLGYNYTLYGETLSRTEAEKDVGVILTPDLRPSKMVARAATRANQVLGAMARATVFLSVFSKLFTLSM